MKRDELAYWASFLAEERKKLLESLKPCPFCGGKAGVIKEPNPDNHWDRDYPYHYFVFCTSCLARGPIKVYKDRAIEEWNMRGYEYIRSLL